MARVFFCADLHLSHEFMAKHRGFKSIEEHDTHVINSWNSVVGKRDLVYILGDISMEKSRPYYMLDQLNGMKINVMGNHDRRQDVDELLKYVEGVAGIVQYKGTFLTHCPIHEMELDYRISYNIHGHIHEKTVMKDGKPDPRYVCVSLEHIDYKPKNSWRAYSRMGEQRI